MGIRGHMQARYASCRTEGKVVTFWPFDFFFLPEASESSDSESLLELESDPLDELLLLLLSLLLSLLLLSLSLSDDESESESVSLCTSACQGYVRVCTRAGWVRGEIHARGSPVDDVGMKVQPFRHAPTHATTHPHTRSHQHPPTHVTTDPPASAA
jgi:hypothetical protein